MCGVVVVVVVFVVGVMNLFDVYDFVVVLVDVGLWFGVVMLNLWMKKWNSL